jgi:hypothetical protein
MLIAKKSQRRFDVRRFRGSVGPDRTPALSEETLSSFVFKHSSQRLQQLLEFDV